MEDKRVLLVDDDINVSDFLYEFFKDYGFHLDTTECPDEARNLIKEHNYQLIFVDITLNRTDGTELAMELYNSEKAYNVIIFTGKPKEWVAHNIDCGIKVIHKPFRIDELIKLVDTVTDCSDA